MVLKKLHLTKRETGRPDPQDDPGEPAGMRGLLDADLVPDPQQHHGALEEVVEARRHRRTAVQR